MAKVVYVSVGIIRNAQQILLTSRPDMKSHAGYWEFPGGKVEYYENHEQALIRELFEELGVVVKLENLTYITSINHCYNDNNVLLTIFNVNKWSGSVQALESQLLHWHELNEKCQVSPLLPTTQKILGIL